jgi:hypothetical protein
MSTLLPSRASCDKRGDGGAAVARFPQRLLRLTFHGACRACMAGRFVFQQREVCWPLCCDVTLREKSLSWVQFAVGTPAECLITRAGGKPGRMGGNKNKAAAGAVMAAVIGGRRPWQPLRLTADLGVLGQAITARQASPVQGRGDSLSLQLCSQRRPKRVWCEGDGRWYKKATTSLLLLTLSFPPHQTNLFCFCISFGTLTFLNKLIHLRVSIRLSQ